MDEKIKLVVALAQQLVDTHQIITVGTHETAAVRIKDIERLRDALEEMDELKRRDAALSSSSPCRHAAEADAMREALEWAVNKLRREHAPLSEYDLMGLELHRRAAPPDAGKE